MYVVIKVSHLCFLLQDLCLPLFCPNNQLNMNGRCVLMIKKIVTKAVGLRIEADIKDNSTLIAMQGLTPTGKNMLRSRCLDLKWTYVVLQSLNGIVSDSTHTLRIILLKIYATENELLFSQMLSSVRDCAQSTWEISVDGRWLSINFTFPSVQPYGREDPKVKVLTVSSLTPVNTRKDVPYDISKLDFCDQVSFQQETKVAK